MIFLLNYVPLLCENGPNASFICNIDAAFDGLKWLAFKQCMYILLVVCCANYVLTCYKLTIHTL